MNTIKSTQNNERLNLFVSSDLAGNLGVWVDRLNVTLSDFVRTAIAERLERLERQKTEQEVLETLQLYADDSRQIEQEWAYADATE